MVAWSEGFCHFQHDGIECKASNKMGHVPCKAEDIQFTNTNATTMLIDGHAMTKEEIFKKYYTWDGGTELPYINGGDLMKKNFMFEPNNFYSCVDSWSPWIQIVNEDFNDQYTQAFFWAIQVTTGIGHDIMPQSSAQTWFTIVATMIGVFLYALIIGSVPGALEHLDAGKMEHRKMMDRINDYMQSQHVPSFLKKDVNDYFDFVHQSNKKGGALTLQNVLAPLPESMRLRVKVALHWKHLKANELFDGIDNSATVKIIDLLQAYVATPGEHLVVQGNVGGMMFLIKSGRIMLKHVSGALENWKKLAEKLREKTNPFFSMFRVKNKFNGLENQTIDMFMKAAERKTIIENKERITSSIRILHQGDFVGENICMGAPHQHSAVALEYCDLLILTQENLNYVCKGHPRVRSQLVKKIQKRNRRLRDEKLNRRRVSSTPLDLSATMAITQPSTSVSPSSPKIDSNTKSGEEERRKSTQSFAVEKLVVPPPKVDTSIEKFIDDEDIEQEMKNASISELIKKNTETTLETKTLGNEVNLVSATPVLNDLTEQIEELKETQNKMSHMLELLLNKMDHTNHTNHNAGSILSPGVSPIDRSKRRGSILGHH
jgi:CRP-like cAMP-binding protein